MRLIINSQEADISGGDNAPRLYKVKPERDENGALQGDYTLNMTLPRTARNEGLLRFTGLYQGYQPYTQSDTLECSLQVNGSEVLSGTLVVLSASPTAYKVVIRGDNVGWKDLIGDANLRDLQFPTLRYSGVRATNRNNWPEPDGTGDTVGLHSVWLQDEADGPFCMPLIGYGNFACSADNAGTANPLETLLTIGESAGLVAGGLIDNNSTFGLDWSRFKPALYLQSVVKKIFNEAGFSVGGTFFSSGLFRDILIAYVGDGIPLWNWGILAQYRWNSNTLVGGPVVGGIINIDPTGPANPVKSGRVGFVGSTDTEPKNIRQDYSYGASQIDQLSVGAGNPKAHCFYAPVKGEYVVEVRLRVTAAEQTQGGSGADPTGVDRLLFALHKFNGPSFGNLNFNRADTTQFEDGGYLLNGTIDPASSVVASDTYTLVAAPDGRADKTVTLTFVGTLEKNEAIAFGIWNWQAFGQRFYTADVRYEVEFWRVSVNSKTPDNIGPSKDLQPANFLPDLGQIEFLKDLFAAYNIVPTANIQRREVSLDFGSEFYQGNQTALDWSDKADIREITTNPPNLKKVYRLSYTPNDDDVLLSERDPRVLFEKRIDIPTARGNSEVKTGLAYTAQRRFALYDSGASGEVSQFDMACLNTDDEIAKRLNDLRTGQERISFDYTHTLVQRIEVQFGTKTNGVYVEDQEIRETYVGPNYTGNASLAIANEAPRLGASEIFPLYFQSDLDRRLNGCEAELEIMLEASDLADLDLRRPVYIGGQSWYVLEVSGYNPDRPRPVNVKLLRA